MSDSDDFEKIDESMVTEDGVNQGEQPGAETSGEGEEKRRLEEEVATLKAQVEARDKLLEEKEREIELLKSSDRKRQLQVDEDVAATSQSAATSSSDAAITRATSSLRIQGVKDEQIDSPEIKKQKLQKQRDGDRSEEPTVSGNGQSVTANNPIVASSDDSMEGTSTTSQSTAHLQSTRTTLSSLNDPTLTTQPGADRVFELNELKKWLKPVLEELDRSDDAVPFKMPVNAIALNIPDYVDIVKHPMDLGTMFDKLKKGEYTNPWQFCDDMWLIFDNAWLYNRRNSIVYRNTTNLSLQFIDLINPAMDGMGCSSGVKSTFNRVSNAKPTAQSDLVFDLELLRESLEPILTQLDQSDYSLPFKVPVNPTALGIPMYFDVVKKPIDLSTIFNKLKAGQYTNPWQFCDDMWLMFDNAWLFNEEGSDVYNYTNKLSELFIDLINPAMREMGSCCGQKFTFTPPAIFCHSDKMCIIARDQDYYCYGTKSSSSGVEVSEQFTFCVQCFDALPEEGFSLSLNHDDSDSTVPKSSFEKQRNNTIEEEKFANCTHCSMKFHKICALYDEKVFSEGFVCPTCRTVKDLPRPKNKYLAMNVPHCKLSAHLEDRVNGFLDGKAHGKKVIIRVLSSVQREAEVKPMMKSAFPVFEKFPYTSKAIFAFEEIDGVEVCFFGMYVQEYSSDCAEPNARRVNIAHLDLVQYFEPRKLRDGVYHELLLGYLDYVGKLGYKTAHIFAVPPVEADRDNIFHGSPTTQWVPDQKSLQDWYKTMLDKGIEEKCVIEYKDIYQQAIDDGLSSPVDLPYFDGDFWPGVIEDCIREVVNNNGDETGDEVTKKLLTQLEKHKEVFLTIRLANAQVANIVDPDGMMLSDMMESREAFLSRARAEHWEFSSLRRAKYSTMCIVRELHQERDKEDGMHYTCNVCKVCCDPWHCNTCDDFDLCDDCNTKVQHEHQLERTKTLLDGSSDRSSRFESIQRCIEALVHACTCRDANCRRMSCHKMKRVVAHTKVCKKRTSASCPVCKQLIALCCYHAKYCLREACQVPFCMNIREKLLEQKNIFARRADSMLRRKMAALSLE